MRHIRVRRYLRAFRFRHVLHSVPCSSHHAFLYARCAGLEHSSLQYFWERRWAMKYGAGHSEFSQNRILSAKGSAYTRTAVKWAAALDSTTGPQLSATQTQPKDSSRKDAREEQPEITEFAADIGGPSRTRTCDQRIMSSGKVIVAITGDSKSSHKSPVFVRGSG